jgi:GalNAc-alpha-(1->4)-GalNAc-alpha-(1->3)-diNAcBac-PP-undecaprenol alpha-1,4-N-acetyl-D-galactosaminyltransferase
MTKKPTLLFTIPTLGAGGAERVLVSLLNYWADKNLWHMILVVHDHPDTPPFYPVHASIQVIHTGLWKKHRRWWIVFKLYGLIKVLKPDGVVPFILWNNILTLLANRFACVPCVIAERNSPDMVKNPLLKILRNWVYGWAKGIVVQTERGKMMFSERFKTAVIPNPVFMAKKSVDYGAKTIIAVGRLCEQKAFDVLIQAFSLLEKSHQDWKLMIFGEGPDRKKLELLIQQKKLEGRVCLSGTTKTISGELAKASIFVLSSRFEGIPNALAEAMALGLSVVSTDCPTGPRELITPLENGILVPVDDVKAMSQGIKTLMDNPKMREDFGKKAAKAMEQYDMKHIAPLWEKEFQIFFKG